MTVVDLESKIVRPELPRRRDPRDPVLTEAEAEALGARVMAAAADAAKQEAAFLELVGEFDACDAVGWWYGLQSTAHWLSWACSISMGTAREHVRVARALRRMPLIRDAFAVGELSYSKVREVTRVLQHTADAATDGPVTDLGGAASDAGESPQAGNAVPDDGDRTPGFDEAGMLEFARACTASQLARSVSGWRAAKGISRRRRAKQQVSWIVREDGTVHFTADLPPEEGAALIAAVQAATDTNQVPEVQPGDEQPDDQLGNQPDSDRPDTESAIDRREPFEQKLHRTRVQGLVEIANHYLGSRPEDRSGEDRTMVVIEVNADALDLGSADNTGQATEGAEERSRGNAGNPEDARADSAASVPDAAEGTERSRGNVSTPAGNPFIAGKCRVRGVAAIEPTDAYRAACDSTILGIIVDHNSVPLAVGREHRLVTKAQRRALIIRDKCCQYPGCHRTRHLKAHHRISWLNGGPTDLDNLVLLCQWHHTRVHEDGITITACQHPDCPVPWRFTRPDGTTISPIIAGSDATCPWEPGRGSFRQHNDQLVADWETEQAALRRQADQLRVAYQHIHDIRLPDAQKIFPVGGGEGFNLANCVTALFHITEPLARPDAA